MTAPVPVGTPATIDVGATRAKVTVTKPWTADPAAQPTSGSAPTGQTASTYSWAISNVGTTALQLADAAPALVNATTGRAAAFRESVCLPTNPEPQPTTIPAGGSSVVTGCAYLPNGAPAPLLKLQIKAPPPMSIEYAYFALV